MSFFKLGGMTLSGVFKKPKTRKYPKEVREPFERTRGCIDMTDIKTCILCGLCEKGCPALCIEVDKENETWQYWPYKCIACDSCVRACPKNILEMKQLHADVTTQRTSITYKKPPLTAEELAEKKRKEKERAEKIAAAKAKKAASQGANKDAGASKKEGANKEQANIEQPNKEAANKEETEKEEGGAK